MLNSQSKGPGLEFMDCRLLATGHEVNNLCVVRVRYLTRRKVMRRQPQPVIRGFSERMYVNMCCKRLLNTLLRIMLSRGISTQ